MDEGAFASYTLLQMEQRKGKTAAVKQALEHINQAIATDLILMTDADALFEADTVSKLMHWFSDSTIGCVGASPKRLGQRRGRSRTSCFVLNGSNHGIEG